MFSSLLLYQHFQLCNHDYQADLVNLIRCIDLYENRVRVCALFSKQSFLQQQRISKT